MITIMTTAKNLREYNVKNKGLETTFIGFMDRGDGYKVRAYLSRLKGTDTNIGDYFTIWFNCPFAEDENDN